MASNNCRVGATRLISVTLYKILKFGLWDASSPPSAKSVFAFLLGEGAGLLSSFLLQPVPLGWTVGLLSSFLLRPVLFASASLLGA